MIRPEDETWFLLEVPVEAAQGEGLPCLHAVLLVICQHIHIPVVAAVIALRCAHVLLQAEVLQ